MVQRVSQAPLHAELNNPRFSQRATMNSRRKNTVLSRIENSMGHVKLQCTSYLFLLRGLDYVIFWSDHGPKKVCFCSQKIVSPTVLCLSSRLSVRHSQSTLCGPAGGHLVLAIECVAARSSPLNVVLIFPLSTEEQLLDNQ